MAGYGNYVYGGGAYGGVVAWSIEDPAVSRTWVSILSLLLALFLTGST